MWRRICKNKQLCNHFEAVNMTKWERSPALYVYIVMHIYKASKVSDSLSTVADTHLLSAYSIKLNMVTDLLRKSGSTNAAVLADFFWTARHFLLWCHNRDPGRTMVVTLYQSITMKVSVVMGDKNTMVKRASSLWRHNRSLLK